MVVEKPEGKANVVLSWQASLRGRFSLLGLLNRMGFVFSSTSSFLIWNSYIHCLGTEMVEIMCLSAEEEMTATVASLVTCLLFLATQFAAHGSRDARHMLCAGVSNEVMGSVYPLRHHTSSLERSERSSVHKHLRANTHSPTSFGFLSLKHNIVYAIYPYTQDKPISKSVAAFTIREAHPV